MDSDVFHNIQHAVHQVDHIRAIINSDRFLNHNVVRSKPRDMTGLPNLTTPLKLESLRSTEEVSESAASSLELVRLLWFDLDHLQMRLSALHQLNKDIGEEVSKYILPLDKLLKHMKVDSSEDKLTVKMKKDLEDIKRKMFNLSLHVPLLPNIRRNPKEPDYQDENEENDGKEIVCLRGIHLNEGLKRLSVFRDVQEKFKNTEWKICLLSFAVFPENQEVNRTMLMYWWIGEGILPNEIKPEDAVKTILKEFTDKNLIEPVTDKRKMEPSSFKMNPFVHASLFLLSKELKLFNIYQRRKRPRMKQSELNKVCLVEQLSSQPRAKAKKMQKVDQIETIFNVSVRFPEFTFKWFSEDRSSQKIKFGRLLKTTDMALKVFYVGRWERTTKRHIEIHNPQLMKNLKRMTKLKLLSLQGISGIVRLDNAVCELHELIILDLRACYNLEKLPDKIYSLTKLIYLDITDCYMIDSMPKRLSWLGNLEVLKGFVVSDADEKTVCTLAELVYLKKLRKLSITINRRNFSILQLFLTIKDFKILENLKVAWGGLSELPHHKGTAAKEHARGFLKRTKSMIFGEKEKDLRNPELPKTLKKLDLQCFPGAILPEWLEPDKLLYLEKLYIKGGTELTGFGRVTPEEPTNCNVKVLRLKFLPKLKVEWRDLSEKYFPKLNFLEKYQCPQVSLCPSDGMGIWRENN